MLWPLESPPKSYCDGVQSEDTDHIHVFLSSDDNPAHTSKGFTEASSSGSAVESRILLGTITGLQTSSEEGSCLVYNSSGTKTHVIMKHRTLLVCEPGSLKFLLEIYSFLHRVDIN